MRILNIGFKNSSGTRGGAIHEQRSAFLLSGCIFEENEGRSGGAIGLDDCTLDLEQCQFLRNISLP